MSYRYPAEWERQKTIWLSFPHNTESWASLSKQGLGAIESFYIKLVDLILDYQEVNLIFKDYETLFAKRPLFDFAKNKKFVLNNVVIANDDIWIRDYGPFFLKAKTQMDSKLLDFEFNAWGQKFAPWSSDNAVPEAIARACNYAIEHYGLILEGGALEFNGADLLVTTEQCLLSCNRNLGHSKEQIANILKQAFSVDEIVWLKRGLVDDHTDGHIDDFFRFIDYDKAVLAYPADTVDVNFGHLHESYNTLLNWYSSKYDFRLQVYKIPMPKVMTRDGLFLPASYANFIYINDAVILPSFDCDADEEVQEIFSRLFPDREILSIDSRLLIQEGGGLHCISKQQH